MQKMNHINIPDEYNRNAPRIKAIGYEKTGSTLIKLASDRVGFSDLSNKDVLDIGCGVRFTQAIINCNIPIKSYTGIDVYEPAINYLTNNVNDSRFSYHHWNVHHGIHNKSGKKLTRKTNLPVSQKKYDLIWLFSVFTHLIPSDAENLLYILRRHIKDDGFIFFSAFIDNDIDSFEDRMKEKPLQQAYFNENYLRRILLKTQWQVNSYHDEDKENYIMNHFVCSPKPSL